MSAINYELLSELIFTNDEIFTDINIKKAKIIARVCKLAKINKNIKKLDEEIYKVFRLNTEEIKLINKYYNRINKSK